MKYYSNTNIEKIINDRINTSYHSDPKSKYFNLVYQIFDDININKPNIYKLGFKKVIVNSNLYNDLKEAENEIKKLYSESPDFDTLYDFANFIKLIEKSFFFQNDSNSFICCDSTFDDNVKTIVFRCKTNKQFEYEEIDPESLTIVTLKNIDNTVTIESKRNYGRKMEFTYKIVNREIRFDGKSDVVLMNNIVLSMQRMMAGFLFGAVWHIANRSNLLNPFWISDSACNIVNNNFNIMHYIHRYYDIGLYDFVEKEEHKNIIKILNKNNGKFPSNE